MNKEYKCAMCGSVSKDTPGTCCGTERKEVVSGEHSHGEGHNDGDGHEHDKKDTSGVCLACQGGNGAHTCGA